jgi:hypothetical protein
MKQYLPWIVLCGCLAYVAAAMFEAMPSGEMDLDGFGRLPAFANGRVQPIDSVARLGLLQIRGSIIVPPQNAGGWLFRKGQWPLTATEWLLELLTKPDAADSRRIFPIQESRLARALRMREPAGGRPTYYAFSELRPKLNDIGQQTLRISKLRTTERSPWEQECLKLRNALVIYERLKNSLQPNSLLQQEPGGKAASYDLAALLAQYQADLRLGVAAAIAREHGRSEPISAETEERLRTFARPYVAVSRAAYLSVVPPGSATQAGEHWENMGTVILNSARTGLLPAPVRHYAAMSSAFVQGKSSAFNGAIAKYRLWLVTRGLGPEVNKADYESLSNRLRAFVRATAVYLVGFVTLCTSWSRRSPAWYRSAVMLVVCAAVLHSVGLLFEMTVEGGPALTNRYSSALFVSWGFVVFAGVIERFRRDGLALAAATLAGVGALAYAHSLAPGGAWHLVQAAFDTSFWLAAVVAGAAAWWIGRRESTGPRAMSGARRAGGAGRWSGTGPSEAKLKVSTR